MDTNKLKKVAKLLDLKNNIAVTTFNELERIDGELLCLINK